MLRISHMMQTWHDLHFHKFYLFLLMKPQSLTPDDIIYIAVPYTILDLFKYIIHCDSFDYKVNAIDNFSSSDGIHALDFLRLCSLKRWRQQNDQFKNNYKWRNLIAAHWRHDYSSWLICNKNDKIMVTSDSHRFHNFVAKW